MYRYRVHLLAYNFPWSWGTVGNQIVALFKPSQTYKTDLSYIFSNYSELDDESKVYASTIADDLFSYEELMELMNLFGNKDDVEIMIGKKKKVPFEYDNSAGIAIMPLDRRTRHISFKDAEKLSFPLAGYVRYERRLIDPRDIEDILKEENLSEHQLREKLSNL